MKTEKPVSLGLEYHSYNESRNPMSHLLTVEVAAENIVELMMENPNFAADLLQEMATAIHAGRLRDDAADICAGMESGEADRIAKAFQSLSEAITDGFNMSHIDVQI